MLLYSGYCFRYRNLKRSAPFTVGSKTITFNRGYISYHFQMLWLIQSFQIIQCLHYKFTICHKQVIYTSGWIVCFATFMCYYFIVHVSILPVWEVVSFYSWQLWPHLPSHRQSLLGIQYDTTSKIFGLDYHLRILLNPSAENQL